MKTARSTVCLLLSLLLLISFLPAASAEEDDNLLINPSFEELDADGLPKGWYPDAYLLQEGYTAYRVSSTEAEDGDYCAEIVNFGLNDARFAQKISVEPNSVYCFSGWVRTEDVSDTGRGANLSVEGLYVFSESIYGTTEDWEYIEIYGETGEDQTSVTLFARLGGYSGESTGKAQFDDLELVRVDDVPEDVYPALWFRPSPPALTSETEINEQPSPFWPWLIVIGMVWVLLAFFLCSHFTWEEHSLTASKCPPIWFLFGLLVSFLGRLVIALFVEGYSVDVNCFLSWGNTMAQVGPWHFYSTASFCDYTPGYLYVLGLNGLIVKALGGSAVLNTVYPLAALIYKLIPCLCDVGMAYLLYRFALQYGFSGKQAALWGLLFACNPAMILNSAAWCQMDSVLCFLLMLVAWLAIQRRWRVLMPVYLLSALIKPQALMLGPLGLLAIVLRWIHNKEDRKSILQGFGISILLGIVLILPFKGEQPYGWLISLYQNTLSSYPYATVNTANLYYAASGNWSALTENASRLAPVLLFVLSLSWLGLQVWRRGSIRHAWIEITLASIYTCVFGVFSLLSVSWQLTGTVAMTAAFAVVLPMYIRGKSEKKLPLLGALLFILLYVLGIKMHERYLFPALILLAMAFVLERDVRLLLLFVLYTLTVFVNSGIVLDNAVRLGSAQGHLNMDTYVLNLMLSIVNLVGVPLAVWTADDLCVRGKIPCPSKPHRNLLPIHHVTRLRCQPDLDAKLHWCKLDAILLLLITAVYAVVGYWHLGSMKAPQNPWKSTSTEEAVILDLGEKQTDFSMLYFCGVSYRDFTVAVSDDGETGSDEYWAQMAEGQCYRWKYLVPAYVNADGTVTYVGANRFESVQKLTGRYIRISANQIGLILEEVLFKNSEGELLPVRVVSRSGENTESTLLSSPEALIDEQDTLEGEPSWYNSTYFDEIYHARTAYEHLHGQAPYETSHPPLGKVLMSLGVAIFGMTPFGWRFMGVLAGVLMLPAMYILGKQLTKKTSMACTATLLMALDAMHFTQTRIATIDSFPVLFILWSYFFMLRFIQKDLIALRIKELLPSLALCGLMMGCGIASKWIGIYAGAGLAVLYFWACARAFYVHGQRIWKRIVTLCLWCIVFFVIVPIVIYLLSYLPYFAYAHYQSFGEYLQLVWNAQTGMFRYHSEPGRGMDHPFYSPWWEWPTIQRPMYYASAAFQPAGTSFSIFCFGNPAVWLFGLVGVFWVFCRWLSGHRYLLEDHSNTIHLHASHWRVDEAFLLIGLAAQFLPWLLVPRGTYIYHYFASTPFLMLCTVLLFNDLKLRWPRVGRSTLIVYLVCCVFFFVALYPYASGRVTSLAWLDFGKQFLHVYYSI